MPRPAVPGNENGRLVVARRPSHDWTNQGRGIAAVVLLPPATGWLIRRSGGRDEALASIPRPDGHPTWFIHSSAASRIGSRTDLSHCTPRRKIGVDEARDWLHLVQAEVITRINECLSPWLPRLSPLISAQTRFQVATVTQSPSTYS